MTLADLTARAAAWNSNDTPWRSITDAEALLRDLLAYATTVSQERDDNHAWWLDQRSMWEERFKAEEAARNMDAEQLCHLMIKLDAAEAELSTLRTRAAQAEQDRDEARQVPAPILRALDEANQRMGHWAARGRDAERHRDELLAARTSQPVPRGTES